MPQPLPLKADLKSSADLPAGCSQRLPPNKNLHDYRKNRQRQHHPPGLPATLTFNTGAAEIMECVGGACEYKLAGTDAWVRSAAGESFSVPGDSTFDIRVAEGFDAYHYICQYA